MKKILSIVMVMITLFGATPVPTFAASGSKLVESRYEFCCVAVREKAKSNSSVVAWCEQGELMQYISTSYSIFNGKWYKVQCADGTRGYISAKDSKIHEHTYNNLVIGDIVFGVCDCGETNVKANNVVKQNEGNNIKNTALLSATIFAGGISPNTLYAAAPLAVGVDGPLPVGDVVAVGILLLGGYLALNQSMPSASDLSQLISTVDFDAFLDKAPMACSSDSFRKVKIVGDDLKFIDKRCMDKYSAYVWVTCFGDVYTESEAAAVELAMMHVINTKAGAAIRECNCGMEDKYFFHYHIGTHDTGTEGMKSKKDFNRKYNKHHIFFGTTGNGGKPTW